MFILKLENRSPTKHSQLKVHLLTSSWSFQSVFISGLSSTLIQHGQEVQQVLWIKGLGLCSLLVVFNRRIMNTTWRRSVMNSSTRFFLISLPHVKNWTQVTTLWQLWGDALPQIKKASKSRRCRGKGLSDRWSSASLLDGRPNTTLICDTDTICYRKLTAKMKKNVWVWLPCSRAKGVLSIWRRKLSAPTETMKHY